MRLEVVLNCVRRTVVQLERTLASKAGLLLIGMCQSEEHVWQLSPEPALQLQGKQYETTSVPKVHQHDHTALCIQPHETNVESDSGPSSLGQSVGNNHDLPCGKLWGHHAGQWTTLLIDLALHFLAPLMSRHALKLHRFAVARTRLRQIGEVFQGLSDGVDHERINPEDITIDSFVCQLDPDRSAVRLLCRRYLASTEVACKVPKPAQKALQRQQSCD